MGNTEVMDRVFQKIFGILESFGVNKKNCFTRTDTFEVFAVLVVGFLVRDDMDGITSIVRALQLDPCKYESLIHALHSEAWDLEEIRHAWYSIILNTDLLKKYNGRIVLLGDGCKQYHDGYYMAAVSKLAQESETQSKAQFIFGQLFGCVSVLIEFEGKTFSFPLKMTIQGGLAATAKWEGSVHPYADESHILQMIRDGIDIVSSLKLPAYYVMDRYFASQEAFTLIDTLCGKRFLKDESQTCVRPLEIITSLKSGCVGYHELTDEQLNPKGPGRPAQYGPKFKLTPIFRDRKRFQYADVNIYGGHERVRLYSDVIYWGRNWYQFIKVVWVISKRGKAIYISTDLSLTPEQIIELYAMRMSCESMYREGKQVFNTFFGHYWSKSVPKLNRFAPSNTPNPLLSINDPLQQKKILGNIHAMESHVLVASIAQGIAQLIAIQEPIGGVVQTWEYKRTYTKKKVSEKSVCAYLRKVLPYLLASDQSNWLLNAIRSRQRHDIPNLGDMAS